MEDAHTTILNVNSEKNNADTPHVSFFAVFDGHGGTAVAQFAGQHLHNKLKNTTQFQQKDYITAMKRGFLDLDEEITQGEHCSRTKYFKSKRYQEHPFKRMCLAALLAHV